MRVEGVNLDGEPAPQNIQQRPKNFFPGFHRTCFQLSRDIEVLFSFAFRADREAVSPEILLLQQTLGARQSVVFERQHAAVFEIRRGDSPAPLQVPIQVVVDQAAKGVVGRVASRASDFRIGCILIKFQREGFKDTA